MNWTHLLAVDSNAWACATYRANMPGVPVLCEMVDPARIAAQITEPVAVLLGGPPCQPFSAAGKGEGADDERDGIPVFALAVAAIAPRWFVMEQVPGVLGGKHAAYWNAVRRLFMALGYDVECHKACASEFGVPQFRKRIWTVGRRTESPRSHTDVELVRFVGGPSRRLLSIAGRAFRRHSGAGMGSERIEGFRWPMPTHAAPEKCEGLFGSLEPWVTCGEALGIVGPGGRIEGAKWWSGYRVLDAELPAHSVTGPGANPELVRVMGGGTNPRKPGAEQDRTERDISGEPSTTIACDAGNAMPAVEYRWSDAYRAKHPPAEPAEPSPTVVGQWAKGAPNGMVRLDTEQGERVRRRTPDECARLQSCPDDWVWPEKMPKTHKYRVIGNGWACRMAAAMAEVVRDADPELRKRAGTVVDLFCGGGLGAVGWSGRYWRAEVHA